VSGTFIVLARVLGDGKAVTGQISGLEFYLIYFLKCTLGYLSQVNNDDCTRY